jgi:glucokinase
MKKAKAENRVSIWRVVSWNGLHNVYSFLKEKYPEKVWDKGVEPKYNTVQYNTIQ